MALISRVPIADAGLTMARALERVLGHDIILNIGAPAFGPPGPDVLPEGATRCIVLPFTADIVGEVTLVVGERFATAMEALSPDADLTTASIPLLLEAAETIEHAIHMSVSADLAGEISTETLLTSVVGDFAGVSLLENDERVAAIFVRVVDDEPAVAAPPPPPVAAPVLPVPSNASAIGASASSHALPVALAAPEPTATGVALYEFQPLTHGRPGLVDPRSLTLLNDVHMEITAELGRCRLKVRDIVALEPGSVIELDKAAGSAIDVLVNGAIVWHGEVVVVDDEFGIRVSEIVVDDS
jgi:flagellar motor switch protein FliN/FliY